MSTNIPRDEFVLVSKESGHSKEFISKALSYINTLENKNMPVIFSIKHLSQILNLNYSLVLDIIKTREQYYRGFKLKKDVAAFGMFKVQIQIYVKYRRGYIIIFF